MTEHTTQGVRSLYGCMMGVLALSGDMVCMVVTRGSAGKGGCMTSSSSWTFTFPLAFIFSCASVLITLGSGRCLHDFENYTWRLIKNRQTDRQEDEIIKMSS